MPKTRAQNQLTRAATRAKLLTSAMALFAERGYGNTSIRDIAGHAEVSVGLLYHYFPGKESLLQAVFDQCMEIISLGFAGLPENSDPLESINQLVDYIFQALQSEASFWSLFYSLRAQPAVMIVLGDDIREWTARLRAIFHTHLADAGLENPELEAWFLYSLIEGAIQQYLLDPDHFPIDAVVEQISFRNLSPGRKHKS